MNSQPEREQSLLVCSVFAGSEYDAFWLELQRQYLARTCGKFDQAVYLGYRCEPSLFKDCIVVGRGDGPNRHEHLSGLTALVEYCRSNRYAAYLVLDSDAFPIAHGWVNVLDQCLSRFGKTFAAPFRSENLDAFPHPCAVYTRDPTSLGFDYRTMKNILGETVTDIACTGEGWFPLVRSNGTNVHPLLAAIYFETFYHHGCGSREFAMRSTVNHYYDTVPLGSDSTPEELLRRLRESPDGYINDLKSRGGNSVDEIG